MAKVCYKCHRALPLTEFYRHPQMADGHLGKCRDCTKADSKANWAARMADPVRAKQERARERVRKDTEREKYLARRITKNALRYGRLVRARECQKCGATRRIETHHPDYSQPLVVQWLCRDCHSLLHRKTTLKPYRPWGREVSV